MSSPVEGCPAFLEGCPFSKLDAELLPAIFEALPDGVSDKWIQEKCPAFANGCAFKETNSVETLYNKLSEMPASHQVNKDTLAAKTVAETLRLVHAMSVALKGQYNAGCPVFATSCPFKTVTTYGAPLVSELDRVIEQWGLQSIPEAPTACTDADATPLSKHLKAGTKIVHRSAENVNFVRDFLKGSVPKDSYVDLLRALYHVYHAMEAAIDGLPKGMKHCDFSRLKRADALLSDLSDYLGTPDGEKPDVGPASPAAKQYVERIQKLAVEDPLMILAHAYTRYLGDLSGGQILARSASKAYNLAGTKGTAFYNFEKVGASPADLKAFKREYRSSFDALGVSASRANDIVCEANMAFLLNILIFEERDVAAGHLERIRTIEEVSELVEKNRSPLEFQKAYGLAPEESSGQCPFIPGAAGHRRPGEPSFHGGAGDVCPWPFIWLHDPKTAVLTHPMKNCLGLVATLGLLRVAWQHPKTSLIAFVGMIGGTYWLKPKKKDNKRDNKH